MLAGQEEEDRSSENSPHGKREGNWVKYNFHKRLLRLLLETGKILHTYTVYR